MALKCLKAKIRHLGDGIAQRKRSHFPPSRPGFESSDRWKNRTNLSLRACRSILFGVSALGVRIKKIRHQDIWNTVQTIWIQANGLDLNLVVQETKTVLTYFFNGRAAKIIHIPNSKVQHIVN